MANETRGFERLVKACGYSFAGLRAAWRHEEAFRIETVLAAVLAPCALWLGRDPFECAVLLATLLGVLITELCNSAIETLTDRVGVERHELSGRAKDIASAAVFLSLVLAVVVWGGVALDRFA